MSETTTQKTQAKTYNYEAMFMISQGVAADARLVAGGFWGICVDDFVGECDCARA